jgi:hypothetical protein
MGVRELGFFSRSNGADKRFEEENRLENIRSIRDGWAYCVATSGMHFMAGGYGQAAYRHIYRSSVRSRARNKVREKCVRG